MKPIRTLAAATASGVAVIALSALPASAAPAHHGPDPAGAVFVQTDATGGNTVVAYDRTATGGLVQAGSYPTGGSGGALSGSVVDHLASEGSLAYDREARLLYAVNAGSDTITVFAVRGDRLARRQVIGSGGQFDGALTQLDAIATGQAATCWITAADGTLYASNAGSGSESVLRSDVSGALSLLGAAATDSGTVDATASGDGRYLYVQAGGPGAVDAFRIGPDGTLIETGSVIVPDAAGAEGIAAS